MQGVMTRILAIVAIIISFVFMGLLYGFNEQLYASLNAHCEFGGERVITLRYAERPETNFPLSASGSNCVIASSVGDGLFSTFTFADTVGGDTTSTAFPGIDFPGTSNDDPFNVTGMETPSGTKVTISVTPTVSAASPAPYWNDTGDTTNDPDGITLTLVSPTLADTKWNQEIGIGGQFKTLTFLLIAVIPLALVAAVISQAVPLIMSGGNSNITDVVNKQTMGLLIAAAVIIAAPMLFQAAADSQSDLVGLGSASRFLNITDIVYNLVPLMYVIGTMGLIIYGSGLVQRFRGGKQRGMGMMGI